MLRYFMKPGDLITVSEETTLQIERICGGRVCLTAEDPDAVTVKQGGGETTSLDVRAELKNRAEEILLLLSAVDGVSSQQMLSDFVSDLFYAQAQKRQNEERRQKQAAGIAKARAKGVQFGPTAKSMPAGFDDLRQAWRNKEMTLREAAEACGVPKSTFYNAALRAEAVAGSAK